MGAIKDLCKNVLIAHLSSDCLVVTRGLGDKDVTIAIADHKHR